MKRCRWIPWEMFLNSFIHIEAGKKTTRCEYLVLVNKVYLFVFTDEGHKLRETTDTLGKCFVLFHLYWCAEENSTFSQNKKWIHTFAVTQLRINKRLKQSQSVSIWSFLSLDENFCNRDDSYVRDDYMETRLLKTQLQREWTKLLYSMLDKLWPCTVLFNMWAQTFLLLFICIPKPFCVLCTVKANEQKRYRTKT